eukprot:SAG31_NODE_3331_length_4396_cov_19.352339_1_plen_1136_part_00
MDWLFQRLAVAWGRLLVTFVAAISFGCPAALLVFAQCEDDPARLRDGLQAMRPELVVPDNACEIFASQAMCGALVPLDLVQYCPVSCSMAAGAADSCSLSAEQCAEAAETSETTADLLDFLEACPADGMCVVAAATALRWPACGAAAVATPDLSPEAGCHAVPMSCPIACAEILLPVAAQCRNEHAALAEALPTGLLQACEAAVTSVLAGVPASITVSVGANCHPDDQPLDRGYEGQYILQPVSVNGRPHYAEPGLSARICTNSDASHQQCGRHLYWSWGKRYSRENAWFLDWTTDSASALTYAHYYLMSPRDILPTGPAQWTQNWLDTRAGHEMDDVHDDKCQVELTPSPPIGGCEAGLAAIAPELDRLCCGVDAQPGCGVDGELPSMCSADCRGAWAPFVARCPSVLEEMANTPVGDFFRVACAAPELVPLPPTRGHTVTYENSGYVSAYPFFAMAGTRYVYQIRVSPNVPLTSTFEIRRERSDGRIDYSRDSLLASDGGHMGADKAISWTAPASGSYFAIAAWNTLPHCCFTNFSDQAIRDTSLSIEAVGTVVVQSPPAVATGAAVALGVSCELLHCAFEYAGVPMYDADISGFDLRLQAEVGIAYAMQVELVSRVAAEVHLKVYYPDSVAGAGGFTEVLGGPLGNWTATPAGHSAFAEDHAEWERRRPGIGAPATFGYHPGESFAKYRQATWAAPTTAVALLRVSASCDVRFFADTEAPNCHNNAVHQGTLGFYCASTAGAPSNGVCASSMTLTITPGAHFDHTATESSQLENDMFFHATSGSAVQVSTIEIDRTDAEQLVAEMFVPTQNLVVPPTLEQMMVPGSEAEELLAAMFTSIQQPHLVLPTSIEPTSALSNDGRDARGRRQTQRQDSSLAITIRATALTLEGSESAVSQLQIVRSIGANGRRLQDGDVHADVALHARQWQLQLQNTTSGTCNDATDVSHACLRAMECAAGLSGSCEGKDCSSGAERPPSPPHVVFETTIEISRQEAEERAAEIFATNSAPATLDAPPTVEQMLVPGTDAANLLATMFIAEQQPHVVVPTAIVPTHASQGGTEEGQQPPKGGNGHRRALQRQHSGANAESAAASLLVTVQATAPTQEESHRAIIALRERLAINGRRRRHLLGSKYP